MTTKEQVFKELDKNPLLKPKQLCAILLLPYKKHGQYIAKLKNIHKSNLKNRQALNCLSFHNTRGWVYVPKLFDVGVLVGCGWKPTRAKNGMLLLKAKQGRLEYMPTTGRVKIWVRKPAHWGKVKTLLAKGFFHDRLIDSIEGFNCWAETARFKGSHLVYDTKTRLPYACIDLLKDGNGVVVKMGDSSHPTALEIEFCYPDYAEKNEKATLQNKQELANLKNLLDTLLPRLTETLQLTAEQTNQFNTFLKDLAAPKANNDNPFVT